MVIKENLFIDTLEDRERTIHIYLPDVSENTRLSVIYMFDGHNLFYDEEATYGTSWGLKDYFDHKKYPIMIVGIECNHEGNKRLEEFSPYDFYDPDFGDIHSEGKEMMEWIVSYLKPYIDTNYNTYADRYHTTIGGSSMGGLMALYAGINYSNIFSKALCLSPYVYYVMNDILKDIKKVSINNDTDLYISYGSKECRNHNEFIRYTEDIFTIQRKMVNKARIYLHLFKGHDHSEASWAKETNVWVKELGFNKIR